MWLLVVIFKFASLVRLVVLRRNSKHSRRVFAFMYIYLSLSSLNNNNNMKNNTIQNEAFSFDLRHFHQKVIPKYHFKICVDCSTVIMRVRGWLVVTPLVPSHPDSLYTL